MAGINSPGAAEAETTPLPLPCELSGDARDALEAGDVAAARAALGLAQQLDPGNSDIARLRAQLARLSAQAGTTATPPPPP